MFKLIMTSLVTLFLTAFMLSPSPAWGSHCVPYDAAFNELLARHPGSKSVGLYTGMDAVVYLGFLNKFPVVMPFLTGDEVIVFAHEAYVMVMVFVFHEGCRVMGVPVPRPVHGNWHQMITGTEAGV